jgi:hypothetical protein
MSPEASYFGGALLVFSFKAPSAKCDFMPIR